MKRYKISKDASVLPLLVAHPMGTSRWNQWNVINQAPHSVHVVEDWYFTDEDILNMNDLDTVLCLYFIKLPHSSKWNAFSVNRHNVMEV